MRDMSDVDMDMGILPTPMLEEAQHAYYTPVNYIAATSCIPSTVEDPEKTSIIIEWWAAESRKTLLPAYYEQAQKSRFSKDIVSPDILDMIFEARTYDLGVSYNWGKLIDRLTAMLYNEVTDFSSMFDTYGPVAETALDIFVSSFQ